MAAMLALQRTVLAMAVWVDSGALVGDIAVYTSDRGPYLGRARLADVAALICHGWLA